MERSLKNEKIIWKIKKRPKIIIKKKKKIARISSRVIYPSKIVIVQIKDVPN